MAIPNETNFGIPKAGGDIVEVPISGTVNVGDFLVFVAASARASAGPANGHDWRRTGAGIAMEASPRPDAYGESQTLTHIKVMRRGIYEADYTDPNGLATVGTWATPRAVGAGAFPITGGRGTPARYGQTANPPSAVGQIIAAENGKITIAVNL